MFALEGHCCNRCYIIPSMDLIVVHIGTGPVRWDEPAFIGSVTGTIIDEGFSVDGFDVVRDSGDSPPKPKL